MSASVTTNSSTASLASSGGGSADTPRVARHRERRAARSRRVPATGSATTSGMNIRSSPRTTRITVGQIGMGGSARMPASMLRQQSPTTSPWQQARQHFSPPSNTCIQGAPDPVSGSTKQQEYARMAAVPGTTSTRCLNDSLFDMTASAGDEMFLRRNESGSSFGDSIRRNESFGNMPSNNLGGKHASFENLAGDLGIDMEEQLRLMQQIEEERNSSHFQVNDSYAPPLQEEKEEAGVEMIDVAPGIRLPLRSAEENWQAINRGEVVVTQCFCCSQHLTLIDDAEYLLCAECWVFSPIGHEPTKRRRSSGVCIGVKEEDLLEWLSQQAGGPPSNGDCRKSIRDDCPGFL